MTLPAEINSTFDWDGETLPAIYCKSLEYVGGLIFPSPFFATIQSLKVQDYTDGNVHQTKTFFFLIFLHWSASPRHWRGGFAAVWQKVDVFVLEKEMKGRSELIVLAHDAS